MNSRAVRLRRTWILIPLALALSACDEPTAPIPPDEFELHFGSWFEQVWGETEYGYADLTVVLPATYSASEVDRIEAMEVVWPIRAIVTAIEPEFRAEDGDLVASRRVIRDTGLGEGTYVLRVRFDDGRELEMERPYWGATLGRPQVRAMEVGADYVVLDWQAPSGAHDWRVSLLRTDQDDAVLAVHGGRTSGARHQVHFELPADPAMTFALLMELDVPSIHRQITFPIVRP